MISFYLPKELSTLGLKSYGDNVLISRKCSIYSPSLITMGDNVRIDDFCILSGKITLGSNIHISAFSALYGTKGIVMEDYTGVSPRTTIFSAMDDFSGDYLIGPIYPSEFTNIIDGRVVLCKFSQLGANTVVFPNITVGEGAVTGAMTLVNKNLRPWTQNFGIPVREVKGRKQGLLEKAGRLAPDHSLNIQGGGYSRSLNKCLFLPFRRAADAGGVIPASRVVRG